MQICHFCVNKGTCPVTVNMHISLYIHVYTSVVGRGQQALLLKIFRHAHKLFALITCSCTVLLLGRIQYQVFILVAFYGGGK